MMKQQRSSKKIIIVVILLLVVLGYGSFEARKLLEGPEIVITSPIDGSAIASTTVTIIGTAKNISFLTIDDAPAFTDQAGNFSLTLSPPPGYTTLTVAAADRFGRRASKSVSITVLDQNHN